MAYLLEMPSQSISYRAPAHPSALAHAQSVRARASACMQALGGSCSMRRQRTGMRGEPGGGKGSELLGFQDELNGSLRKFEMEKDNCF